MANHSNSHPDPTDLVNEIVEVVLAHGPKEDEFVVYDSIDPEALAQALASSSSEIEVHFEVAGIPLTVTKDGVEPRNRYRYD